MTDIHFDKWYEMKIISEQNFSRRRKPKYSFTGVYIKLSIIL